MDKCRVVLVRTRIAGNLGATARAMRNMGLSQLVLVAPEADRQDRSALQLSTHGQSILEAARIVATFEEAVADCRLVAATSARVGGIIRKQPVLPEGILTEMAVLMREVPTALVFGPEASGLTDLEITRCHALIHIPADPAYPALNLAQSVAICLYELRRAWLRQTTPPQPGEPPAPFEMQDRMFQRLRGAMEAIHFLYGPQADYLMHGMRQLIGRARPTQTEVDILFGLARQLQWYVDHHSVNPTNTVAESPPPRHS